MFRQMKKRREFLDEAKKGPGPEEKKPEAVIAIGIGAPKKGAIDPGAGADALAGDEDALRTPLQKKAALLADHHQKLADEYRAKADAAKGGPLEEETPEEEALESPEEESLEDEGSELHLPDEAEGKDEGLDALPPGGEDDELEDGLGDEMFPERKKKAPPFGGKKVPMKGKPY